MKKYLYLITTMIMMLVPISVSAQEKALVYYGTPDNPNGVKSVEKAVDIYDDYDIIVLGDGVEFESYYKHKATVDIITALKQKKPSCKVFGYVPIGCLEGNDASNLSMAEIKNRIDLWASMGVAGIFLDEYGYDYKVTRARQNECLDYIHGKKLIAFVNSWKDDYVFSNKSMPLDWINNFDGNPKGVETHISSKDYILYENLFWRGTGTSDVSKMGSQMPTVKRAYDYAYNKNTCYGISYRDKFGTKNVCLDSIHSSVSDANRKNMMTVSIVGSLINNVDGIGFGDEYWGSKGSVLNWNYPAILNGTRSNATMTTKNTYSGKTVTYNAKIDGTDYGVTFKVSSNSDTSYNTSKRYATVNGTVTNDIFEKVSNTTTTQQANSTSSKIDDIIKELNINDADAYHKVLAINDYMYENFKFVQTQTPDTASTLLTKGESNCQGFCQLFIELTKKVGVESAMVYQDYTGHRWNVVKMDDGKYYFVDVATNRYMNNKRMYTLKGTKGFYYTMNSSFKYDVNETDYKYDPKEEPKEPVVTPNEPTTEVKPETKPVVDPKPEVKPTEPTTEQKPETTPTKPSTSIGNNGANGLFYFSKSVPSLSNIKQVGITIGKEIGSKIVFTFK